MKPLSSFLDLSQMREEEWRKRQIAHGNQVNALIGSYFEKRAKQVKNPILDFLFEYYSFRPSLLKRWSPGIGILLLGERADSFLDMAPFCRGKDGVFLDPSDLSKRREGIKWILDLLEITDKRVPQFACHGLHEWAMVYRVERVRHANEKLRLPPEQIASLVEGRSVCCSHYDAFRFFTQAARPLNRYSIAKENRLDWEQRGCIHTNMDLYKWAYKFYPWIGSDLIWECFCLAWKAREIDMRASPYELSHLGLEPIRIETEQGRREYEREQKRITQEAEPLRKKLLAVYQTLFQVTEEEN